MAHSVFTSICCRNEDDEEFVTVDDLGPSTRERPEPTADVNQESQGLSESDLLKLVKLNLEDGATDGRRPTVVQMVDGTFQLQRGMIEFNLKVKTQINAKRVLTSVGERVNLAIDSLLLVKYVEISLGHSSADSTTSAITACDKHHHKGHGRILISAIFQPLA